MTFIVSVKPNVKPKQTIKENKKIKVKKKK